MTPRFRNAIPVALLSALVLAVGACGGSTTATEPSSAATASPSGAPASAAAVEGLTGEDFVARAPALSGSAVTLKRCSLLTTPGSDGTLACRVLDSTGTEITDDKGLPVDVFVKQADLNKDAQAVLAGCEGFCTVQISGKLDRATDGTGYLSMTDVTIKAVD